MYNETRLQGYITNTPEFGMPQVNPQDIAITTVSTFRSVLYSIATELAAAGAGSAARGIRITGGAIGAVPFTVIDIAMSWNEEGGLQATVTGLLANGTGVLAGIKIGTALGGTIGNVPGAVVGAILGGLITMGLDKALDDAWDYAEQMDIPAIFFDNMARLQDKMGDQICNMSDSMLEMMMKMPLPGANDLPRWQQSFDDAWRQNAYPVDPLMFDLDGDGKVSLTSLENGSYFDIDNDGFAQKISWISQGDGVLCLDRNGNGVIDNGFELFGENTLMSNGQYAKSGIEALVA